MTQKPSAKNKERFNKAIQELRSGNSKAALQLFEKVRKSWRDDADLGYLEGVAHGRIGNIVDVIRCSRRALKFNPNHYGAMCNLANALMSTGKPDEAISYYKKALNIKTDAAEVMSNYGNALIIIGNLNEAGKILTATVRKHPTHAPAHSFLGQYHYIKGDTEAGRDAFNKAIELDNRQIIAHIGLGNLYADQGLPDSAVPHFTEALSINPHSHESCTGLVRAYRQLGEFDNALKILDNTLKNNNKNNPKILALKADILERHGKYESAYKLINKLNKSKQLTPVAISAFARLSKRYNASEQALEMINRYLKKTSLSTANKQTLYFAAGDLLDKQSRFDEAFNYYKKANECSQHNYSPALYNSIVNNLIDNTSTEKLSQLPVSNKNSTKPVFILGMPRSGSSLIEQILSTHPDVYGGGEINEMMSISSSICLDNNAEFNIGNYITLLTEIPDNKINEYAEVYLEKLKELNADSKITTDKLPANFFNIPLISSLLPNAKIIHCKRDPLDTCLSIYFQQFSSSHDYASSLENIAHFYSEYNRLMKHFTKVSKISILEVNYEDLIYDQENISKLLLEHCEINWDDSVLDFHKNTRTVATASYDQVRQPVYTSSVNRWKNYEPHIDVLKTILN